ncbi:Ig-like domain-containing protein, partial [Verminephrobacter aporrectodeae]
MTNTTNLTAAITISSNKLGIGKTATATIRFSEAIDASSFTTADLTVGGGVRLSNLRSTDGGSTWEVTLTAPGNPDPANPAITNPGTVRSSTGNQIRVNLAGVTNLAGKAGVGEAVSTVTYDIDARRPSATITLADSALTAGETTTVTFTFNEPVTGFDASDVNLSNANGTLGPLTAAADGKTWTATFTPTANVNDTTNTISVNLRGVSDLAGNIGTRTTTSANYTVDTRDTIGPTATITLADSALTAGETTTVTFTFSEPVSGFDASDVDLSNANGTLGPLTSNANRTVWTATFTPTANVNDTTNTIRVNLSGVSGLAGNAGTRTITSANYTVDTRDTTAPTATITLADSLLTAGETTTVTFRFSEPVTGFDASDIDLSDANGTLGPLTPDANRTVWTATFTPTANASDVTNTIRVNLAGVTDDAGNAATGIASSDNYFVDTMRPTATITLADTALTAGETTTVTFRFSTSVTGFDASNVNLSNANGTLGPLTSNANHTVWTATFTPTANVNDTTNTIRVNLAGVSGYVGNIDAISANYSVNTVRPTATITLADTALTVGESTTVTFTFNEPVNGFDASDIDLSNANGTLGPLTPDTNRTVWTATFTPTANASAGANTIRVNLAGVRDVAGNAGTGAATSANYSVDTRDTAAPTATITLADTALTAGETTTVTFRFSEPVSGFDANDINLSNANGSLGPLTPNANRTVWTATFTPTANASSVTNTILVNLAGVRDDAGNVGTYTASSANYSVDTVRPTATITLADTALTAGETTTVSFRFNEPVSGFDANDIDLSNANGTLGPLTPNANRTVWTATLTPTAYVNSLASAIYVNLAGVRDDAGNIGTGSAISAYYSVDTMRPTATITLADTALAAGETTTVTFRFSEPVTGFDASDINLSSANGTLGPLTPNANRTVWTATFTPRVNDNSWASAIYVNLAGVRNDAGNAGTYTASSAYYTVDTVHPWATITLADSALTAGETTPVTFRFNEPVNGFDASDINLSSANGSLGPLTPNANRTVWTATFTPRVNDNSWASAIYVNLAGVRDDAGNAGTYIASSAYYSVDTVRPWATITLADTALTAGETTTVSFRFNEPVNGFDTSDIDLSDANGSLGPLTPNANRTVWTATYTPTANANDTTNTLRVNLAGVRDDAGNAGTGSAISAYYSVDTVRPTATITLADTALAAGETTTVTFRFNEPVTGFDASDIWLGFACGTLGPLTPTANRTVWTATLTPRDNANSLTNFIYIYLADVSNDAGNAGTGIVSCAYYSVDTVRPTATITLADTALTAGETTTVTFRFNEPVNGLDTSDIDLSNANGTLGPLTPNANRTVWTATFTPRVNDNSWASAIYVNLAGVRDDAGNAGTYTASSANYSVDTVRPTATITLADSLLTEDETTTVTFRFNEPVNGLDARDIDLSNANGTLSPLTPNANRTVWTATYAPTAGASAGANTIRVNLAGVTDDAGNAGADIASSGNYSVDTMRPMATITLADTTLTAGETTTVTFRFNEPVTDFDASDLSSANGTLGPLTPNANRTVWTATFTPTANVSNGANTIYANLTGVRDDAGNTGTYNSPSSAYYSVDTVRPTATITLADTALAAGETTTVTFRFNEPVTGFDANNINLSDAHGTLGPLTPDANRTAWTATFTPTANVSAGANTIRVNFAGVSDVAGNAGTGAATSANYTVDTRDTSDPTTTITLADSLLTVGETTTVTFRFSEPVTGFDASNINLSNANGSLGPLTPNANRTAWTATFTPTADASAGTNTIRINLAGVRNAAGNAGTGNAISANYSVDTMRPTVTITLANKPLIAGETTTVTFSFNEPVNGFDASDIWLQSAYGTLGPLTPNANRTAWTATLTTTANDHSMLNIIYVFLAGVTDDAGNAGTDFAIACYYVDPPVMLPTMLPTATITLADTALTAGETTTVTFRFNEPVSGFDTSNIDIRDANGTLGPLTPDANRMVWTATFTPTANVSDMTNTIRVALSGVRDAAGNISIGSAISANYTVNTTRPWATISMSSLLLFTTSNPYSNLWLTTSNPYITVFFEFSEPVNGFDLSDIVYTNGALSTPMANADRTVWTATLTPTANTSAGANTIRVNLAGVTNDAGNAGTGSTDRYGSTYGVDTVRPTATITLADSALTAGETTTVTFRFSEPVSWFYANDIVCSNGTLSPLTPMENTGCTVWTASFTPTANVYAPTNAIRVNLAGVRDDYHNVGTETAISANYSMDTRPANTAGPTATITLANPRLAGGESTTVTFAFGEPVTGFTRDDAVLTHTNGTLGEPATHDHGRTWTATFTPTANVENDSNTIGVNLAGVTNAAGHAGTGLADSVNYQIDTRAPVVASAGAQHNSLWIGYTEGTYLDTTHIPPATAFTVRVDNVLTAVTAVTVPAQRKSVNLTLATPVANGQVVTVAYTDPTTGNDANAIQDTAGNDAASFSAIPVNNRTPAQQDSASSARSAPLTPSNSPAPSP